MTPPNNSNFTIYQFIYILRHYEKNNVITVLISDM